MTQKRMEAALTLAKLGLRIHRLLDGKKLPATLWRDTATTDLVCVENMFRDHPNCNYGVVTGERESNGVFVMDVDPRGLPSYEQYLPEEPTLTVRTPRKGFHFYFKGAVVPRNSANQLASGIDIRGFGGYVVGPYCELRETGGVYTPVTPMGTPIRDASALLMKRIRESTAVLDHDDPVLSEGFRNKSYKPVELQEKSFVHEDVLSAIRYLATVKGSRLGEGSDTATLIIARHVLSFIPCERKTLELMERFYIPKCNFGVEYCRNWLSAKIKNAVAYDQTNVIGAYTSANIIQHLEE